MFDLALASGWDRGLMKNKKFWPGEEKTAGVPIGRNNKATAC